MSRKTPSTKNVRNQVAIDAMIEGYQLATVLKEPELKMGFNNAINALRAQEQYISTYEEAIQIHSIKETMGLFIFQAANGAIPDRLQLLRQQAGVAHEQG